MCSEITRLAAGSVVICVDGPFAPASVMPKARLAERFLMSGPFAAVPPNNGTRLRLMRAPAAQGNPFVVATDAAIRQLCAAGLLVASLEGSGLAGEIVEIFPTIMAALLPPQAYVGRRALRTDALWDRLRNAKVLSPYGGLVSAVESQQRSAGNCMSFGQPPSQLLALTDSRVGSTTFLGHASEQGFILPSLNRFDAQFLGMFQGHWNSSRAAELRAQGLVWV